MSSKPGWRGDCLALLAGASLPLAFAPFGVFPVAVISPALLFASWLQTSPKRSFWRGALFGLAAFAFGISWIFVSIHDHGHVDLLLSLFLTVLLIVVQALFPALAGYCAKRWLEEPFGLPSFTGLLLVFPAVWVFFEWIRGWFLSGFPWLVLGYSQIDSPLAGLAPLAGVYGVSLGVAVSAGLLLCCFSSRLSGGRRIAAVLGIVLLWSVNEAMRHVAWTRESGAPIKVSLIQGNIPQDMKWLPSMRQVTIDLYTDLTRQHWDSDLVIWPESAVPVFYSEAADYLDDLAAEAQAMATDLLIGVIYDEAETGRYYNSVLALGQSRAVYHKHHLVPFTEYLPFKNILGGLVKFMDVPMSNFSAGGRRQPPLILAGHPAAITICYEDAFGEELLGQLPAAEMLVNVSNDAWFGDSIAPHQHLQIARMRAAETRRPLLRATNTGITAIIEYGGKVKLEAPQFADRVLTGDITPRSGSTPYTRLGNYPVVTIIFMLLSGIAIRQGLRKNNRAKAPR